MSKQLTSFSPSFLVVVSSWYGGLFQINNIQLIYYFKYLKEEGGYMIKIYNSLDWFTRQTIAQEYKFHDGFSSYVDDVVFSKDKQKYNTPNFNYGETVRSFSSYRWHSFRCRSCNHLLFYVLIIVVGDVFKTFWGKTLR